MRRSVLLVAACTAFVVVFALTHVTSRPPAPPGIVWILGGEFTMDTDSDLGWPDEKSSHRVKVNGFFVDVGFRCGKSSD